MRLLKSNNDFERIHELNIFEDDDDDEKERGLNNEEFTDILGMHSQKDVI